MSDFDIVVVAVDLDSFSHNEAWLRAFGTPLICCRDTYPCSGAEVETRLVLYEDSTKIDFSLWPVGLVKRVAEGPHLPDVLDPGYRVLVDKDGLTRNLQPPTFTAHIPDRPSEAEFISLVEKFWFEAGYVARNLRRDNLFPAKYSFDGVMKFNFLRRMLEWSVEVEHDWSVRLGFMGKGLRTVLNPDVWSDVEGTFVGARVDENWQALFRTARLFRETAQAVAAELGYRYPAELDRSVMAYLVGIKDLERLETSS